MAGGRRGRTNKTRIARETNPSLPSDMFTEILSWLPVKSIIRCKSVCKEWKLMTEEETFIKKHAKQARTTLLFKDPGYVNVWLNTFKVVSSSEGLALEKKEPSNYRIKNPATRQVLPLPDPVNEIGFMYFNYVSGSMVYKLIHLYAQGLRSQDLGCEILTVDDNLAWRGLNIPILKSIYEGKPRVFFDVNDSGIFYILKIPIDGLAHPEITVVNMVSECVYSYEIRGKFFWDWNNVYPLMWKGNLSLTTIVNDKLIVWVLDDYKINQWADRDIIIPLTSAKDFFSYGDKLRASALSDNILYIFVNDRTSIAYDIEEKKVTRTEIIPSYGKLWYGFRPSLVHLRGMQAE